ncbi:MAG TPA: IPT/TIG domain-containing protein [Bryobacteraceae bacterium]|nr:IPT/TIG domain-containing protein [Bryobacteraceae bacterium]
MSTKLLLCAALAWTSQAATVTLTTNPAALNYTYQIGAAKLPAVQTISVKVSSGTPAFTAVTPNTDAWITVDPSGGNLPATVNVRVNPTTLPASTYTSTVTITVTGIAPVVIPVTLVVSPPLPTLGVSSAAITLNLTPFSTSVQTVTLSTNGAPISFTATAGAKWVTVTPTVGVVLPGALTNLTITIATTTLAPQVNPYTAKVTLALSGASVKAQNITLNVTVNSAAPTITSVWPTQLPLNGPAQTITIQGTNFYTATVAMIQGISTPLATTIFKDSSTVLQAVVPANFLTSAATLNVLVANPAPGGNSLTTIPVTVGNTASVLGIVNAASFASGPVSPGDIVTIFGNNLGPSNPASLTVTNGFVDTSLGGVSVTIDGKNAPMLYVSPNQLSIQVPYEVSIGANKAVVVTNGTNVANSTVTTAATAPGIFTANGSGAGQAAALTCSATTNTCALNSVTNLAKIGDIVTLYVTGEGIYNIPPLSGGISDTGYIVPASLTPLPQMTTAPTVTIGGQAADTTNANFYAGPIPGSILGLLQINAVVPAGASTGVAVPIVVTIGANSTQAGVTLAIHP